MPLAEGDFRRLFEASPDVLLVLLPDSPRFTMVAATDARLAATHTTRETLGMGLFEVFPDNPEELTASGSSNLRASLDRVLQTRGPDTMAVQKYDIRGPNGTFLKRYWSPKNIPVLDEDGRVTFILHRVEDVTELVEASELGAELRDRTKQMERDVIVRSRELAEANRELRDANARLGELDAAKTSFFSNVSHEFRTPLTLILGVLEGALSKSPSRLDGEDLAGVHRNALRLLRLVNNLLDFSRIEAGRLSLHFVPTDLARLTAGLGGAFQSLFSDAGLSLTVECPPLPEPIYVDAAQWEKIVLNLMSNAFKFTLHGGVTLRLRWCDDHVELHVSDTGVGIPEAEVPRIFQRFYRVQGAEGRSFEGSGIGLSLVHELTRLHGGSVRVATKLGSGSTFIVSVPTGSAHLPVEGSRASEPVGLSEPVVRGQILEAKRWLQPARVTESRSANEAVGKQSVSQHRGRILVADDNADMREYIERLLAPFWLVQTVSDGAAALAAARAAPPDLVLSDMMMPRMDGAMLLHELRSDERTNTIPVILISARAGEEARLEGLETGADDYLIKPFSARELLSRVNTHLEMARVRRSAYDQLAATQAQLVHSAKMASLGQLVAGIAHEINNPLAFALSHLVTIERGLKEVGERLESELRVGPRTTWERVATRVVEMRGGLERIRELVLKLRTFSRLDEGDQKVASIRDSFASALTILNHRIEGRVDIVTDFGEPDALHCYPGLLNQALLNLLTNALDAIEGNGTIRITTGARGAEYLIAIEDSGSGISPDIHAHVFNPFFTTKPVGQGTGLGLSITYSIVQKHGGSIELRAADGGGARAEIRLPLNAATT